MNKRIIEKIDYCIYKDPRLIPTLFKDTSIKKGILFSRLKRVIPRRVGIEFECIGRPFTFNDSIKSKTHNYSKLIEDKYRLKDYKQDYYYDKTHHHNVQPFQVDYNIFNDTCIQGTLAQSSDQPQESLVAEPIVESDYEEFRVSIKDYSQLKGLYLILDQAKKNCEIPIGGGIHIHIDFSQYFKSDVIKNKLIPYVTENLNLVENIFPKYDGTYNDRKVGYQTKRTYVNFSHYSSIEFRIAPLTFDYETLIKWVIGCQSFVSKMILDCHLQKAPIKPKESITLISDAIATIPYNCGSEGDYYVDQQYELRVVGDNYVIRNTTTNSIVGYLDSGLTSVNSNVYTHQSAWTNLF